MVQLLKNWVNTVKFTANEFLANFNFLLIAISQTNFTEDLKFTKNEKLNIASISYSLQNVFSISG